MTLELQISPALTETLHKRVPRLELAALKGIALEGYRQNTLSLAQIRELLGEFDDDSFSELREWVVEHESKKPALEKAEEIHPLISESTINYWDYITVEPNKRGGKPCVRGLRITVYEVLEYLASEMNEQEILADFPDLTREDLKACIAYAADHERRMMVASVAA